MLLIYWYIYKKMLDIIQKAKYVSGFNKKLIIEYITNGGCYETYC